MRSAETAHILYRGEKLQVEFYFSEEGRIPAKELLESINDRKIAVKLTALAKLIADRAVVYDEKKYRIIERRHRIFEFKILCYRFFSFFSAGGKVIITSGYRKGSKKVNKQELNRAIRLKQNYTERVERDEYYEKM